MNWPADNDLYISNEQLLERCKQQDQDALRALFRRHEQPTYNLLLSILSNRDDADEALAEVFIKVWKSAKKFKGDSKFTTWLYTIASNTAKDILRSRKVRKETAVEDSVLYATADSNSYHSTDPAKSAINAEEHARIYNAMKHLPEEDRLIISLYHIQECEYDEISSITGISPANLKVKLFRARQKLRKLCEEMEDESGNEQVRTNTTKSTGLQQRTAEGS